MTRKLLMFAALAIVASAGLFAAQAQVPARGRTEEIRWEYKVFPIVYNPGERLTDDQRASAYERSINHQAANGWELVGSVLDRDTVQTVGGGVTTRDTVSFLAYRRPKR